MASRVDAQDDGNDDEYEMARVKWAALLGPHLAHALGASESYTKDDIKAHLAFFSGHVCAWLGREPLWPLRPACPSALTCDATPLEISYSWNGTASVAVRYVVDVIAPDGNLTRSASLAAAQKTIDGLRGFAGGFGGYRIDMLPDVWVAVTARLAYWERTVHAPPLPLANLAAAAAYPCELCSPSSTFIGFDLASSGRAHGKLYWLLPSCLSARGLLHVLDDVFALLPPDVDTQWAQVRHHLALYGASELRPRMLCIDATRYPTPRIKLYSRCHFDSHASFAAVEPHLTLGGAVPLPPHSHYATMWARLQARYRVDSRPRSRYCMVVHDMLPLQLRSKLYWLTHQMPCRDALIINDFLADFAQPTTLLRRQLHAGHLSDDSTFIKEIGLTQRDGAFDIAAYISPALFST
jgi:DMATS type aromatic prenyltransferase